MYFLNAKDNVNFKIISNSKKSCKNSTKNTFFFFWNHLRASFEHVA